jgi:long-chain acyl-CoA synthetase
MDINLARAAESALERLGDHPSLFFEGTWYSSGELAERSRRVARGLVEMGVGPGDRVVVIMANCPEVPVLYGALWRAGAVVTPVVFLVTAAELRHILADSGAVAVVTSPELLPKVKEATDESPLPIVVVGEKSHGPAPQASRDFADLEAHEPMEILNRGGDDLAALLYTGGTTGRSKGVPLTHSNLYYAGKNARSVSFVPGITRGLSALPMSHSFGLLVQVGGFHNPEPNSAVLQRWFDPVSFVKLAAEHKIQVMSVVPSMLVMMLGQPLEEYDLSNLRYAFSGAAPLSPAVREEIQRRIPSVAVMEGYGCTETAGILSATPPLAPRPGTVGKPVPEVDLRIRDLDGNDLPVGGEGEIVVRGPNVMGGYWGGEPIKDGWFHTGDVGRLDAEGYLTIVDRIKDLIIRGGYNVYPRDVEDALLEHPEVAMAGVVGRPDDRLGEEVVAFVSLTPGATVTADELIEFTRSRMAANKYPREVHIVDAVPLTSVGKLDRKRLRATVTPS